MNETKNNLQKHSTQSLSRILRGTLIALGEALADAEKFRRKATAVLEELNGRGTEANVCRQSRKTYRRR